MLPTEATAMLSLFAAALLLQSAARRSNRRLAQGLRGMEDRLRAIESKLAPVAATDPPRTLPAPPPVPPIRRRVDPPAVPSPGPTLIEVPSLAAEGSEANAAGASAELSRRFGAIWSIAESGASAEAIARATGQPIGQVELILGLRRRLLHPDATLEGFHES